MCKNEPEKLRELAANELEGVSGGGVADAVGMIAAIGHGAWVVSDEVWCAFGPIVC
jgi:hypothetical protein